MFSCACNMEWCRTVYILYMYVVCAWEFFDTEQEASSVSPRVIFKQGAHEYLIINYVIIAIYNSTIYYIR